MLLIALIACVLVAVTATIHAVGLAVLMKILVRSHALSTTGYHHIIWLLIGLTFWLSLIHIAEIAISGRAACLMQSRRSILPELPTRPLVTANWCCRNLGACSHRSRL